MFGNSLKKYLNWMKKIHQNQQQIILIYIFAAHFLARILSINQFNFYAD